MIIRVIKVLSIFVILLHFLGITQYASSYAKNKSSFLSMMTMAEEENKKEKDGKEDVKEEMKEFTDSGFFIFSDEVLVNKLSGLTIALERIKHQFIAEQVTPPPNILA